MALKKSLAFARAHPEHDAIIAAHYLAIWESYGTPQDGLRPDARQIVLDFLKSGRHHADLASFVAFDSSAAVGSASCILNPKGYPIVLRSPYSKEGYIWSVFIKDGYRGQGIGRKLVSMAVEHLERSGCTDVVLHASEAGRPLYAGLGFEASSEMRLHFERAGDLTAMPVGIRTREAEKRPSQ